MPDDAYTRPPQRGDRGFPVGPLGRETGVDGGFSAVAIGFCPRCGANARRTTAVRGIFDCPSCTYQWYDSRVGDSKRSFEDFFSKE